LFGYLLFLTLVLILFPTFVSHCVTPFRLYLSFHREDCSSTADSGTYYLHGLKANDIEFLLRHEGVIKIRQGGLD